MTFVPANNVVQMALIFTLNGQRCENTFHYYVASGVDLTKLAAIAHTAETWARAHPGLWPDVVKLEEIYCIDLTTEGSWTFTRTPDPDIDGTDHGECQPNNVTFAFKRQTGHAGRKNRGRIYWVGISRGEMTDANGFSAATAANKVGYLNTLKDNQFSDNGAREVLLHKADGTHVEITDYSWSDLFLDSQRRRLPGHNIHH